MDLLAHFAMFETFDHTADLGLRVRAGDLPGLMVEAARGLFSIIVPELETVRPREEVSIRVSGQAADYLLFDWLSELLYRFEVERRLFSQFEVTLDESGLSAIARGEPYDESRHELEHEVKAITYHGLKLEKNPTGYEAEVIVDI